jgi:hypothetical protein
MNNNYLDNREAIQNCGRFRAPMSIERLLAARENYNLQM